jgi:hypothetical protein
MGPAEKLCRGAPPRFEEPFMSSIAASNTSNNPYSYLQYLEQQGSSPSGGNQGDPLSALLAALGQGTGTTAATAGAASSTDPTTSSASTSPQFDPQTLQTLFAMQANGANSQSLASQLDGSADTAGPGAAQQADGAHDGHHHQPDNQQYQRVIDDHNQLCGWIEREYDDGAHIGRLHFVWRLHRDGGGRECDEQQSPRAIDPDAVPVAQSCDHPEHRHGLVSRGIELNADWT